MFHAIKTFKNIILLFNGDAETGIFHRQRNVFFAVPDGDIHAAAFAIIFDRIIRQIQDEFKEQTGIAENVAPVTVHLHLDILFLGLHFQKIGHLLGNVVKRHILPFIRFIRFFNA